MLTRILSATTAFVIVCAASWGGAQESSGGWDTPLETHPILSIRAQAGRGEMAGSNIELDKATYRGLVLTPAFSSA